MPGPAPKDPKRSWIKLPAEGRKGPAPKWPLAVAATPTERAVWRSLWASPQAVAWEKLRYVRVVARFCRLVVEAERPGAGSRLLAEVRQMEHDLGLTPMGMRRLEWVIVEDELAEKRDQKPRLSAAERLAAAGE